MASRLELQNMFEKLIGNRNVYFQPPASIQMSYPAIVYALNEIDNAHANNSVYKQDFSYEVTVIDEDPDGEIAKKVSLIPTCRFNRHFTSENLNHYVFTLYS